MEFEEDPTGDENPVICFVFAHKGSQTEKIVLVVSQNTCIIKLGSVCVGGLGVNLLRGRGEENGILLGFT